MNKNIMLPIVALMILAMAGFASAATVEQIEVRGTIVNVTGNTNIVPAGGGTVASSYTWTPYNFAAFWYDEDDDLWSEQLTIEAINGRTIAADKLVYNTTPKAQTYAIIGGVSDVDKIGIVSSAWITKYYIEGWMAEKYVAIDSGANSSTGNANKLSKLLVEFTSSSDKKTLSSGEAWDLGGGFTITAGQIDLDGNKVWLSLDKNGANIDDAVIDTSTNDKEDRIYTYTTDMDGVSDVVLFSCYVDAVFRGTDSNLVQLKYVFLIDNEILVVKSSETYGDMEVTTASGTKIELMNKDNTISLTANTDATIMSDLFFRVADNDTVVRFYPCKTYTIGPGAEDSEIDTNATATATETADGNVSDGEGEGEGEGEGDGEAVATATAPTEAEAEPTEAEAEETATKKKVPGFESIFAISGLLAVAYLVLRQRD